MRLNPILLVLFDEWGRLKPQLGDTMESTDTGFIEAEDALMFVESDITLKSCTLTGLYTWRCAREPGIHSKLRQKRGLLYARRGEGPFVFCGRLELCRPVDDGLQFALIDSHALIKAIPGHNIFDGAGTIEPAKNLPAAWTDRDD